jgi:hypothetical protein
MPMRDVGERAGTKPQPREPVEGPGDAHDHHAAPGDDPVSPDTIPLDRLVWVASALLVVGVVWGLLWWLNRWLDRRR